MARARKLYAIEAWMRAGPRPATCRALIRTFRARPHLKELKDKIVSEHGRHLPKRQTGRGASLSTRAMGAVGAISPRRPSRHRQQHRGEPHRTGEARVKNYLFIGNAEPGPACAFLYNLIANCREQKIDAERYLEEALRRMPINATPEQAAEMTPAKLAPLIRELQSQSVWREKTPLVAEATAA